MGSVLQKPVLSTIVERKSLAGRFRVGVAEINGWRTKMEDAHVIHLRDDWACFGVFDGHGGDQCSDYVAKEFRKRLDEHGCPATDADVKNWVFEIDQAFLDTGMSSGSTAAMCIVHRSQEPGGKLSLRVINIGDSRVFLGRPDGTIVDGGGTEEGLSTDHKPNYPSEKERIYRCGGTVETADHGVARVNGDLAVSRSFGDAEYKKTGGPGPEDRPVTVDPELGVFECDEGDFLVIACDGVSEGEFPNPDVVKLIGEQLREGSFAGGPGDAGAAAREVILKAEKQGSKDNVTCMVVQFCGAEETCEESIVFTPGPVALDEKYLAAYEVMAKRAGTTLAQSLALRYENISKQVGDSSCGTDADKEAFNDELKLFGEVEGEVGSDERTQWFENWLVKNRSGGSDVDDRIAALRLMAFAQAQRAGGAQGGPLNGMSFAPRTRPKVRLPDRVTLEAAVEAHPGLNWDEQMERIADSEGYVKTDDESDGTLQVVFEGLFIQAWVPKSCVTFLSKEDEGETSQDATTDAISDVSTEASSPAATRGGGYDGESSPVAPN